MDESVVIVENPADEKPKEPEVATWLVAAPPNTVKLTRQRPPANIEGRRQHNRHRDW